MLFRSTDWGELWGIADRTNYDLTRHQEASGKSLESVSYTHLDVYKRQGVNPNFFQKIETFLILVAPARKIRMTFFNLLLAHPAQDVLCAGVPNRN